jgi:DNA-nicking Smr family endonuclease
VRPLGDRKRAGPAEPEELPPSETAARERLAELAMGDARFEVQDDGVHVEGRRLDVGADVLRRLRRGGMPIDARLDLHERTVDQAKDELVKFLGAMRARGERCVLVIHGKGEHSPRGVGILRGEVGAWLSQGRAAMHVAAFATATATDGGSGATYVLLRSAAGAR